MKKQDFQSGFDIPDLVENEIKNRSPKKILLSWKFFILLLLTFVIPFSFLFKKYFYSVEDNLDKIKGEVKFIKNKGNNQRNCFFFSFAKEPAGESLVRINSQLAVWHYLKYLCQFDGNINMTVEDSSLCSRYSKMALNQTKLVTYKNGKRITIFKE